jgi:hypothetical protein
MVDSIQTSIQRMFERVRAEANTFSFDKFKSSSVIATAVEPAKKPQKDHISVAGTAISYNGLKGLPGRY